jgi:hypothetical protein
VSKANIPLLALGLGGWTPCHVVVNGIYPLTSVLRGTRKETQKSRGSKRSTIVDLIAQARERGDTETVEKLTDVEDSLQVPEMDRKGNENDDDGNRP